MKEDDQIELYGWAFKMENTFDFKLENTGQKPLVLKTKTQSTTQNILRLGLTQLKSRKIYTKDRVQSSEIINFLITIAVKIFMSIGDS